MAKEKLTWHKVNRSKLPKAVTDKITSAEKLFKQYAALRDEIENDVRPLATKKLDPRDDEEIKFSHRFGLMGAVAVGPKGKSKSESDKEELFG